MFEVISQLCFDQAGNCHQVSVEIRSPINRERLGLVVAPVGPFDDFSEVYAQTYQRAVETAEPTLPGFEDPLPQDHPRVLLRRSTDPKEPDQAREQLAVRSS